MARVQLVLPWHAPRTRSRTVDRPILVDGQAFPVEIIRRRGARRYIVRVTPEAIVRITVPYGAPIAGGVAFAERQRDWIAREWARRREQNAPWRSGAELWFRGVRVRIEVDGERVRFATEEAGPLTGDSDLRPLVLAHLRALADTELPARCRELADALGLVVTRVSVRNQRSRWGACSSRKSITLNWRLVQVPVAVRDYIIHHELAHLVVPNHSRRFWREVERLCPDWRASEGWLRCFEREIM
jgi:predicted metal-dependent hydrolase